MLLEPKSTEEYKRFDNELRYQAMTTLPDHIERKLLTFNIMQLCSLVCEKNGGNWTGASDRYGPIQEIARRWDSDALFTRITDIPVEDDIVTYSRIMTAAGGNPTLKDPPRRKPIDPKISRSGMIFAGPRPGPDDPVGNGLAGCLTVEDLKKVAEEQCLDRINWVTVDGLKNFGLKRMYVGNAWRNKMRRAELEEKKK